MEIRKIKSAGIILGATILLSLTGEAWANIAVYKKISLGQNLKHHRMTIGDLNGDGKIDYVFNDGRRSIKAFDHDGALLWEKINPNDPGVEEPYHNFTISVYDITLDGKAEVICFLEINGEHHLAVVEGATGNVLTSIQLPFVAPRDHDRWGLTNYYMQNHVAIANLRGLPVPQDILAIHASKLKVAAYSYENGVLVYRWFWITDHEGYSSGHHAYPYDITGDGRDEVLAGVDILDPDGNRMWKIELPPFNPENPNWGPDHVDAMTAADIDPDNPGKEIVVVAATGMWLYSSDGTLLWHHPTKVTDPVDGYFEGEGVQEVMVADLLPDVPGLEMVIFSEDMYTHNSVALFDCKGNVIRWDSQSNGPRRWITAAMDWNGDRSVPEIYSRTGIFDSEFDRISSSMIWSAVTTLDKDEFPPVVADVQGDHREEILYYDEDEIVIFHNAASYDGDPLSSPWEDLRYRLRYANLNHTSPMYFDWKSIGSDPEPARMPPEPPENLESPNTTENSISLRWSAAPPAADGNEAVAYHLYRGGIRIAVVAGTTYTDTGLKDDMPYSYRVLSVDGTGKESLTSADATFRTVALFYPHAGSPPETSTLGAKITVAGLVDWQDGHALELILTTTEPVVRCPTPLIFVESDQTVTQILMTGTFPGSRFTGYLLMTEYLAEGVGTFRLPEGSLVSTLGNTGNLIVEGATLNIRHPGINDPNYKPPETPAHLTSPLQTDHMIVLNWVTSISGGEYALASRFRIYRDGEFVDQVARPEFADTGLRPNTAYRYAIYAADPAGNLSPQALEGIFSTRSDPAPAGTHFVYAFITAGDPLRQEGRCVLPVVLTTSEPVVQLPSPLSLHGSDQTITRISLSGKLPGDRFTGTLPISDQMAGGEAMFSLPEGSLVTATGKRGEEILTGGSIFINRTPPPTPKLSISP